MKTCIKTLTAVGFLLTRHVCLSADEIEKWITPDTAIKRFFQSIEAKDGKVVLTTKSTGPKYLLTVNGAAPKLTEAGQVIAISAGDRIQMSERHGQLDFFALHTEPIQRFAVVWREDMSSFGGKVTLSASVFELKAKEMIGIPEAEGRAALATAKTKPNEK